MIFELVTILCWCITEVKFRTIKACNFIIKYHLSPSSLNKCWANGFQHIISRCSCWAPLVPLTSKCTRQDEWGKTRVLGGHLAMWPLPVTWGHTCSCILSTSGWEMQVSTRIAAIFLWTQDKWQFPELVCGQGVSAPHLAPVGWVLA
jgi:hypothetical protein